MNTEFNQSKFRTLLKKGIGLRTQKEFAEVTGIAPATINRMLNERTIPCPKRSTLETLAKNMSKVSLSELLEACGYEVESIADRVTAVENKVSMLIQSVKNDKIFDNEDDLIMFLKDSLDMYHVGHAKASSNEINDLSGTDVRFSFLPIGMVHKYDGNDLYLHIFLKILCLADQTSFIISDMIYRDYVTQSKGTLVSHTGVIKHIPVADGLTAEERLLKYIFGDANAKRHSYTEVGHGFYYDSVPEGFMDFLNIHADTFCDNPKNIALYQEMVTTDKSPEEVFGEYISTSGYNIGVGGVIADIIEKEMGVETYYCTKDRYIPEELQDECIMQRLEWDIPEKMNDDILFKFYQYAKQLKISHVGTVYHHTSVKEEDGQMFDVNKIFFS